MGSETSISQPFPTLTVGRNRSAVQLDERADEREADPQAAARAGQRHFGLGEQIEYSAERFRRNPDSRVRDSDASAPRIAVCNLQASIDLAAGLRVLAGVVEQVGKHLLEAQ